MKRIKNSDIYIYIYQPIAGWKKAVITINVKLYKSIIDKLRGKIAVSFKDTPIKERKSNVLYPTEDELKTFRQILLDEARKGERGGKGDHVTSDILSYITGFNLPKKSIQQISDATNYEPMNERLRDTQKISTFNKYLVMEPIQYGNDIYEQLDVHKSNECWLNVLEENYSDTLLRQDKQQNLITREMILNLLNKTEETVKNGSSISEIMLFYQKYNLRLRIINQFDMLVHFFNPTHFSKRNKPTYVLMKDNHVYNITYTESLEKKISKMQSINDDQFDIKISDNYKCDIVDYKDTIMIEDVKELITFESKEKQTLYVILKDNDIDKALYKLKEDLGYTAGISFSDNRVNKLYCNFGKNITFIIQRQQLTSSPLGFSDVNIDNLQTYINMNHVMTDFHNQLFIKSYKSSYSDEDIQILDSYRTIVPCKKQVPI